MNNTLDYNLPFTNKIDDPVVFQSPWHSQLFAITVQLSETGNFSWKEFVKFLEKSLNESRLEVNCLDGEDDYFNCWLIALEEIIISKKLGNSNILSLLKKDWTNAYLSTPHGKSVKIN